MVYTGHMQMMIELGFVVHKPSFISNNKQECKLQHIVPAISCAKIIHMKVRQLGQHAWI
jgi:hypothetical protein